MTRDYSQEADVRRQLRSILGISEPVKTVEMLLLAKEELERLKAPIPLGLKKIAIATAYDADDSEKIENVIFIYDKDSEGLPFGTEFPEDVGKRSDALPIRAYLKVHGVEGADELIHRLDYACKAIGQRCSARKIADRLQWAVCKLYDKGDIGLYPACTMLGGLTIEQFMEIYAQFPTMSNGV